MNIFGILGAAALLPRYNAAKERLKKANEAMKNLQAQITAYDSKKYEANQTSDENSGLSFITPSVVWRISDAVNSETWDVDGWITLENTSTDRIIRITGVAVDFTIFGSKVQRYIPIGVCDPFILEPGKSKQIPLSGNSNLIIISNIIDRNLIIDNFIKAYNSTNLKPGVNECDIEGVATSGVAFYYTGEFGISTPIRAIYREIPCIIRFVRGWIKKLNYENEFSATRGYEMFKQNQD